MKSLLIKILSFVAVLGIIFTLPVFNFVGNAFSVVENGIKFASQNDKVYVIGVTDETITDLVIPEYVQERKVEGVSLSNIPNITSVIIPSTVASIFFRNCSDVKAYYVDENNEKYCSQDGVIYDKEFKTLCFHPIGNTRKKFNVPKEIEKIGESAFESCLRLEKVNFNEGLMEIGEMAFYNCRFEKLRFPDSLTKVYSGAFAENMNLKDVIIPKNLKEIQPIFYGCQNLATVTFLDDNLDFCLESSYEQQAIKQYASMFDGCYGSIIAYVPDKKIEKYKELSELWKLKSINVQPLSQKPDGIIGDADYNDKIGIPDAVTLMTFLTGKDVTISANADINQDGKINVFDIILIKRMLMKK